VLINQSPPRSPAAVLREVLYKSTSSALSDCITPASPTDKDTLYAARVSLDETQMQVEDKLVNLTLGMAVTVEIKTGTRRIIEYLISPPLRYRHESLRER
jgi:hypothetical protein